MSQIGQRARKIRLRRGESQEKVARRADISTSTLIRIEKGQNQPSTPTLIRLAAALEVTSDDLLGEKAS